MTLKSRVHIALPTTDLAASAAFYTALFGEGPDKTEPDYLRFSPPDHPIVLSVMPGPVPERSDRLHYGLRFGAVAATKAAWTRGKEAGLALDLEGEVSCCWSAQQKAWATDPDGRSWELYTVVEDLPVSGNSGCCA